MSFFVLVSSWVACSLLFVDPLEWGHAEVNALRLFAYCHSLSYHHDVVSFFYWLPLCYVS